MFQNFKSTMAANKLNRFVKLYKKQLNEDAAFNKLFFNYLLNYNKLFITKLFLIINELSMLKTFKWISLILSKVINISKRIKSYFS